MVEQEAVNFEVAGSSPASGAIIKALAFTVGAFIMMFWKPEIRTGGSA